MQLATAIGDSIPLLTGAPLTVIGVAALAHIGLSLWVILRPTRARFGSRRSS